MYVYLFFGEIEGSPDDLGGVDGISYLATTTGPYRAIAPDGRLIGIYRDDGAKAVPEIILAPA